MRLQAIKRSHDPLHRVLKLADPPPQLLVVDLHFAAFLHLRTNSRSDPLQPYRRPVTGSTVHFELSDKSTTGWGSP